MKSPKIKLIKQEKQKTQQEKQRADSAELEIARLRQLLLEQGVNLPDASGE